MRVGPTIGKAGENESFHDSSLIAFNYLPVEETLKVVLSTPNESDVQELWEIRLSGVLAIELETLGDGEPVHCIPPEIYDVYDESSGTVAKRWETQLQKLGIKHPNIHVITFASSYLRGWGEKNEMEGIRVACRKVTVEAASEEFGGNEYSRPRIASDE